MRNRPRPATSAERSAFGGVGRVVVATAFQPRHVAARQRRFPRSAGSWRVSRVLIGRPSAKTRRMVRLVNYSYRLSGGRVVLCGSGRAWPAPNGQSVRMPQPGALHVSPRCGPGVVPDPHLGSNREPKLLPRRVARAGAARVELVGTDQTQLDVLPVGLRLTAGAVRPAAVQRGGRVIVQA